MQDQLTDQQQEDICQICEISIMGCARECSSGWMCEGRWCNEAFEMWQEEQQQNELEERIALVGDYG